MLLLMPMLLLTTSVQKLVGLDLRLPAVSELPPERPGTVEDLTVELGERLVVRASVRRSDVVTSAGEVEARETVVEDLAALQRDLRQLKQLDPRRSRILVLPEDSVPSAEVVAVMDAVRGDAQGELFPEVALGGIVAP